MTPDPQRSQPGTGRAGEQEDHREHREHREHPPEGTPFPSAVEPDFAAEHTSPTFADELAGGPERIRESESPKGLAGMDSWRRFRRWLRRPARR